MHGLMLTAKSLASAAFCPCHLVVQPPLICSTWHSHQVLYKVMGTKSRISWSHGDWTVDAWYLGRNDQYLPAESLGSKKWIRPYLDMSRLWTHDGGTGRGGLGSLSVFQLGAYFHFSWTLSFCPTSPDRSEHIGQRLGVLSWLAH